MMQKAYSQVLYTDFADNTVKPWGIQANSGDIAVVPDPAGISGNVMKVHINVNENYSGVANGVPRAEILSLNNYPAWNYYFNNDSEYVIRFKTFLPADFQFETVYSNPHLFVQVHQNLSSGSPQFSIVIDGTNYKFASDSALSTADHTEFSRIIGSVSGDLNSWVEWIIFYRPSHDIGGEVIIWKNKQLLYHYKGVCAYSAPQGYLKFGIYKWNWQKRANYHN